MNVNQERGEQQQQEQRHRYGQRELQDRSAQQQRQPTSDWRREIEQGEQHRQLRLGEGGQHRQLELGEMQQRQRRTQREMNEAEGRDGEERRRYYDTGTQMRVEGMVGEGRGRGEDQWEQGPLQRQSVWQHQYEGKGRGHTRGGLDLSNQPND